MQGRAEFATDHAAPLAAEEQWAMPELINIAELPKLTEQDRPIRLSLLEAVVTLFTDGVFHGRMPTEDEYMKAMEQSITRHAGPSN